MPPEKSGPVPLQGTLELLVLHTLTPGPLHGYAIAQQIGKLSQDVLKVGAKGMDLSYDDTMIDLVETMSGALLGAAITLLRHPRRLRQVPGRPSDPVVVSTHDTA